MGNLLLALFSVVLFCVCCHFFMKAILQRQPVLNQTGYTRAALRIRKSYQVFALGTMTFVFLLGLVASFMQVYVLL